MVKRLKHNIAKLVLLTVITTLTASIPFKAKATDLEGSLIKASEVTITAKSENGSNKVGKAIDGSKSTYWESSNHYRWVQIDLEGTYNLSSIKLFNKVGGYYNYNIYASSDGENYIKVADKNDQNLATAEGDVHNLGNIKASSLRIDVTFSSQNNNSNIAEIELYGNKVSNEKPVDKEIQVENFDKTKWATEYDKFKTDTKYANQKTISELSNMVERVIGAEYKDKFVFELREATAEGDDVFEVQDTNDGKILIKGNNGVSLASGFNYYLKNYAKVMYNPIMGSNLNMPETLPSVGEKVVVDTPYEHRYELNFCTYSYTMSFWDWDEYEAFLDWSAMNGFNLVLDIIGQEEVLRRTLKEFNYSDEEIKEFISGPAYFAWFYMQNMTSFGGPLPDNWFEERTELGRKMHDRMQTLGINPVLQGYSGMVPLDFKTKNPDAQIISQGGWSGFSRPHMLRTYVNEGQEDYFEKVADVFYEKQKEVFGDITDYYAVDPFHEGGNTGGLNDGKIYGTIQSKMIEHDKDAVWVIQHWQGNPSNGKINGLADKSKALILDLNSELKENDYKRFESLDVPWVWNMLHNFGGRMGLDGQPERLANNIPAAYANSEHMKGIGITPEAINNSPIVYELIGDMIWTTDKVDYKEWTYDYIERRYGKVNEDMVKAWDILLNTAYKKRNDYYQGAAESVINSRPATNIRSASTWGNNRIPYDKKELEKTIDLFINAYDELKGSEAFIYDFLDVTKQVLANSAQEYHKEMVNAYNSRDLDNFNNISTRFLNLIKLQERVLATSPEFLVGTWIDQSRTMLQDADDWTKDLFEFNARALITTWGDYKNGSLKDYSNRQWAGLTEDLYYKRWEMWVDSIRTELQGGKAPSINWHRVEYEWAVQKTTEENAYATKGSGENLSELAAIAMKEFSVTNMDKFLNGDIVVEKQNIALGKPVESSVETDAEYPTKNLTDGTTGTAWMAKSVTWPVDLTLDLQGKYDVERITFSPNQAAGGFAINYVVEVFNDGKWTEVKRQDSGTITGTIDIEYKGKAEKVRLKLSSNNKELIPEMTEIAVYGEKVASEFINVALNKKVTGSANENGKPVTNVVDGNLSSLWVSDQGKMPAEITIDLEKETNVDHINLHFEKSGFRFKFKVETEDAKGVKKVVLDKTNNTVDNEKSYKIPVEANISKVHVTITGKADGGSYPAAWAALAEVEVMSKKVEALTNVALNKPVTGSVSENGKPLANVVDGNVSSLWVSDQGKMPANAIIDLQSEKYVDHINLHFEKAGFRFQFMVEVEDKNGNKTIVLDNRTNTGDNDKTYKIPVGFNAKKVHVTITGKADGGSYPAAWAALAEVEVMGRSAQEFKNIALNKTVTGSANESGKPLTNVVDGNLSSLWVSDKGKMPANVSIDLDGERNVDHINLHFEKAGFRFQFKVEIEDKEGKKTTVLDKTTNTGDNEKTYKIPVLSNASKVHVTITGKADGGSYPAAWAALAEVEVMIAK